MYVSHEVSPFSFWSRGKALPRFPSLFQPNTFNGAMSMIQSFNSNGERAGLAVGENTYVFFRPFIFT